MKSILKYELPWHEKHLTLICLICFLMPFIVYLAALFYVVLRYMHHQPVDISDGFAGYYVARRTPVIIRKLKLKK